MTFQEVLQESVLPVLVADENGLVLKINASFTNAFGWTPEALVGKSISKIIPKHLRDAHQMGLSRMGNMTESNVLNQYLDLEIVNAEGGTHMAPHYITMGEMEGQKRFAAIIKPA